MTSQQLDVDKLAREKVEEIEKQLEGPENCKLDKVNVWFSILKQIITAADLHRTQNDKNKENPENGLSDSGGNKATAETGESIYADYADDNEQFHAVDLTEQFASNSVKWTIRVHAFKIVHRLVNMTSQRSVASKHLPDLVRLAFVAATSPYDDLKLQGFEMFKFLINRFAAVEEKEFPGHSILEQYRTQVLSALKPAFNLDSPPYITAIASQVCCLWICRGLEKDSSNLKKTFQLLLMTVEKLENQSVNQNSKLYTESELEQERLDILGTWAQLYIKAQETGGGGGGDKTMSSLRKLDITSDLNELVKSQLPILITKWWEALKDYALLIMPAPRIITVSHDHNEHVYTREVALHLFEPIWPKLILATSIWLCSSAPAPISNMSSDESTLGTNNQNCDTKNTAKTIGKTQYFKFICGILMKEFCRCCNQQATLTTNNTTKVDSLQESTVMAVRSLTILVSDNEMKLAFINDLQIVQEFYSILYNILINCTKIDTQHHLILKNLLQLIFNLVVVIGLGDDTKKMENLKFGLSYLAEAIEGQIKLLSNDTNNRELFQTNLFIRLYNIIQTSKLIPELDQQDLDLLRNTLLKTMQALESIELITKQSTLYTDSMLKLLNIGIILFKNADAQDRCLLLGAYFDMIMNNLNILLKSTTSELSSRHKELLHSGLRIIKDLSRLYSSDYESVLATNGRKQLLNSIDKCLTDAKNQTELKLKETAKKSSTQTGASGAIKPKAKIVLKADFSNFYSSK